MAFVTVVGEEGPDVFLEVVQAGVGMAGGCQDEVCEEENDGAHRNNGGGRRNEILW